MSDHQPADLVLHRSYLYVPGHREDLIDKAYAGDVDAVVLELEDGVAESHKDHARRHAGDVLRSSAPKPTWVRVNPPGSAHFTADVEAVAGSAAEGLRLPKVDSPEQVRLVATALDDAGSSLRIQALLESALGVERVSEIATAHARLAGVALGEQDLRADVGASDEGLMYARSRVVFAARAAGLPPPVQSVWTDIGDLAGLRVSCEQGKRLGMFGRSAVHPRQVPVINEVFTPTTEELEAADEAARLLVDAAVTGAGGVRTGDGRFVDQAVLVAARRAAGRSIRGGDGRM